MNKSYRKSISNKPMIKYSRYRKYNSNTMIRNNKKYKSYYKKLLGQLLLSILIILVIILIKSIDSPITNETSLLVKNVLNTEYNYKKSLSKISEYGSKIKDYTKKAIPVFNNKNSSFEFVRPIDGIVVSTFGENYDPIADKVHFQRGIDIQGTRINIVKSIDDGVVEVVGESENLGKFIKINHNEKIFSIYSNLEEIFVKENQKILKGEKLGKIGDLHNSLLHFELWIDDEVVDPQLYIDYESINI